MLDFIWLFKNVCFDFTSEKIVQGQIEEKLRSMKISYLREYRLDTDNIPDFIIGRLCVEVKIKGTAKAIYKQLERYAAFDLVEQIVLITNKPIGNIDSIQHKPVGILKMGNAWL